MIAGWCVAGPTAQGRKAPQPADELVHYTRSGLAVQEIAVKLDGRVRIDAPGLRRNDLRLGANELRALRHDLDEVEPQCRGGQDVRHPDQMSRTILYRHREMTCRGSVPATWKPVVDRLATLIGRSPRP